MAEILLKASMTPVIYERSLILHVLNWLGKIMVNVREIEFINELITKNFEVFRVNCISIFI